MTAGPSRASRATEEDGYSVARGATPVVQHGRTDRFGGGQQPHHYAGPETTEITVYPRASRSPSLPRRLVERLFF